MKKQHHFSLRFILFTVLMLFLAACSGGFEPSPASQDAAEEAVEEAVEESIEEAEEMVEEETSGEEEVVLEEEAIEEEVVVEQEIEKEEDLEAVGSEEDDGSPFTPTSGGKKGGSADESDVIGWLTSADDSIEEPTARVLANHVEDVMLIHTIRTETFEEKVILARSIIFYERKLIERKLIGDSPDDELELERETVYLPLSINRWFPITNQLDINQLSPLAETSPCEQCSSELYEIIAVSTPEETVAVQIDLDQDVPEIKDLLALIRDLQTESRARVRLMSDQLD
ncbi:MAG: hypothetical protein AAF633_00140 [Chloroflexota bacterium]